MQRSDGRAVERDGRRWPTATARRCCSSAAADAVHRPAEDVRFDELVPSESRTVCAYKGFAAYWALPGPDGPVVICWTYRDPQNDAVPVKDMICFFNEMVD